MSLMAMSPAEVRAGIVQCFEAGLVPFVTSSPGMGKSSIAAQIAEEAGLELIDVRLSQCAPEDLMGLPMRVGEGEEMKAAFAPFNMFPVKGDDLPKGKHGWLLLLDEMNSAPRSVQASAYKIVLDRYVGQHELHPECYIMAAGNLASDKAIVNTLSTAMQSRLIHMEMALDHKAFMDHATAKRFDYRILAFLEFMPGKLHDFDPDHTDKTFACPRTWEFASKLIKDRPLEDISVKLLAGTVGQGVGLEFHAYMSVFSQIPTYGDICADPENATLPKEPGLLYATISMLIDRFTPKSFAKAGLYAKRLPPEFQVIYFRGIKNVDPKFIRDPLFIQLRKDLTNFLTEDDEATLQAA